LETCCGYGYEQARDSNRFARIFKGPRERSERRRSRDVLREQLPYLQMNWFHGCPSLKKKRKLSSELSRTFSSYFALPPFLTGRASQVSPRPGSGILTRFPFDQFESYFTFQLKTTRFRKAFANLLGPTDPCATAVHMEPFSTSVFKVLT
jgi:hypothetical protein